MIHLEIDIKDRGINLTQDYTIYSTYNNYNDPCAKCPNNPKNNKFASGFCNCSLPSRNIVY